jgi:SSS family solute:Na+ symporter
MPGTFWTVFNAETGDQNMEPGKLLMNEWMMILFFVLCISFWGVYIREKAGADLSSSFLAGRKVPGFIGSLSTVATNMNANDFIGGAGAIYAMGLVMLHQTYINCLVILFLSLFLMRKLRRHNVFTLGEWLRKRYSNRVGNMYSIIWAFIWMLFNLGLYIYAGALVLHTLVGWNLYLSIVILTLIAATYTLLGGFGAVVATDVVQIFLMFFPFIFLVILIWQQVGSPGELLASLPSNKADLWGKETPFGHLGITIFGMLFLSMSYWGAEAQILQRPLSTKNPNQAAISYIGAGFWYALLSPLVIFIPALAAIKLFPGLPNNDFAVPMLIKTFLPPGLYGITIVGLLAGIFSSCDSQINAFCTMFSTDIYKRMINPKCPENNLLKISKISGVIFTLAAIGTALIFSYAENGMFLLAIGILATIMPPFGAVTIIGAIWKKSSPRAAFSGLIAGFTIAIILFALDLSGKLNFLAQDTLFFRAMVAFLTTCLFVVIISLFDSHHQSVDQEKEKIYPKHWFDNPNVLGLILAVTIALMYILITVLSS